MIDQDEAARSAGEWLRYEGRGCGYEAARTAGDQGERQRERESLRLRFGLGRG